MPLPPEKLQQLAEYLPKSSAISFHGDSWQQGVISQAECHGALITLHSDRAPAELSNEQTNTLVLRALGAPRRNVAQVFNVPQTEVGYCEFELSFLHNLNPNRTLGVAIDRSIAAGILVVHNRVRQRLDEATRIGIHALAQGLRLQWAPWMFGSAVEPKDVHTAIGDLQDVYNIRDKVGLVLFGYAKGILNGKNHLPIKRTFDMPGNARQ